MEDIHNATAITYPQVYRMPMTGARLKEVLEDVADNSVQPRPVLSAGRRHGALRRASAIAIDVGKPIGQRISAHDASEVRRSRSSRSENYTVAGWASVNEGTQGPPIWERGRAHVASDKTSPAGDQYGVKISGG